MELFRRGLALGCRVEEVWQQQGSLRAVELALSRAKPGELVLVQADVVQETIHFLKGRRSGQPLKEIVLDGTSYLFGNTMDLAAYQVA
jgi:cyanophycin synthetase